MSVQGVLVVDEDRSVAAETADALGDRTDVRTRSVSAPEAALDELDEGDVDCLVTGICPTTDGWTEFFEALQRRAPDCPVVLFSDRGTDDAADSFGAGVDSYCPRDGQDGQYDVLANVVERSLAHREREQEREQDIETYRTIVEAAGDAMYALDEEGYLTMANDSHAELSGVPKEELIGSHVLEYMRDEDVQKGTEIITEILSDPDKERGRFEFRGEGLYPGEEERFFEDILAVRTDEDGNYAGSVGVIRDITERKHRERELKRQNERLDEFASVVAHDLRTPLSVATGLVEGAADRYDDADLREAHRTLERMERMIEDLLTLARQGQTVDELEPVDFLDVLAEAWPDPEGATLEVEDPPERIMADDRRLTELLENLFRNALEHAGPDVTVTVGGIDADRPEDRGFYVADDGPGIPPEDRMDIFEHGYTTEEDGTGFGLAIVNRIAGAHEWEVRATEGEDGGARFEITGVKRATEAVAQ